MNAGDRRRLVRGEEESRGWCVWPDIPSVSRELRALTVSPQEVHSSIESGLQEAFLTLRPNGHTDSSRTLIPATNNTGTLPQRKSMAIHTVEDLKDILQRGKSGKTKEGCCSERICNLATPLLFPLCFFFFLSPPFFVGQNVVEVTKGIS